jgi:hypothetical protein
MKAVPLKGAAFVFYVHISNFADNKMILCTKWLTKMILLEKLSLIK